MVVPYERVIDEFLQKVTEYKLLEMPASTRDHIVRVYMKSALSDFVKKCREPLEGYDDDEQTITMKNDIDEDEFANIISDGMVYYWFKQFMHNQTNLMNHLNSLDFSSYSPAELLKQVKASYEQCRMNYTHELRAYTYDHGDLTDLHL